MRIIFHIASKADWVRALDIHLYSTSSLAAEGFIHCSTAAQVINTANRLFKGRPDLLLLCIDTEKVQAEIHDENLEGGTDLFPHIYGAIPMAAIVSTHEFAPDIDGTFSLPALPARAPN